MDDIQGIIFRTQPGSEYTWDVGESKEDFGEVMKIDAVKNKDGTFDITVEFLTSKSHISVLHPSCLVESIFKNLE